MTTPCWSPFATTLREISPRFAYIRMLRATSEMAAAMTVWSPVENPAPAASSRPCWRACTTSTSDAISTLSWSATLDASTFALLVEPPLGVLVEKGEALFQVEGRRDALEGQPELHHREGDLGLDAHDHRFRAPEPRHVRDVPRSEEHTSELQSRLHLVCRLLLEKKKNGTIRKITSTQH